MPTRTSKCIYKYTSILGFVEMSITHITHTYIIHRNTCIQEQKILGCTNACIYYCIHTRTNICMHRYTSVLDFVGIRVIFVRTCIPTYQCMYIRAYFVHKHISIQASITICKYIQIYACILAQQERVYMHSYIYLYTSTYLGAQIQIYSQCTSKKQGQLFTASLTSAYQALMFKANTFSLA
eukprot:TRINITY_DN26019_c0_g1_i1.p1 TRINITY_DN26019_c0_g1~~TRINITY_DN26019_c0_g1_i1.p1  ORF type:complete len:206 (-),score=-33.35 TRINITY_DN26019_c0_g1_i1:41-583(-)